MRTDTIGIQVGSMVQDVYGEEVGQVTQVWPYVPVGCADGPPVPGQAPPDTNDVGYFCVDRGGIQGVATMHLYFPFKAVEKVEANGVIRVTCTEQECEEVYSSQPWFADRDIV